MPQKTDLIRAKVKRAYQHIEQLQVACDAFIKSDPYEVVPKRNPDTRRFHHHASVIPDLPVEIPLIVGDILCNLRGALDHLAYALVFAGTKGAGIPNRRGDPFRHVQFPIFDTPKIYESHKMGSIQGMTKLAIQAIDRTEPYQGGNDSLWLIRRLNNIDKHRLLITAGARLTKVYVGGEMNARTANIWKKAWPDDDFDFAADFPPLDLWIEPVEKPFPLKVGDELFIGLPDAEPDNQVKFAIEIAIGEPGVIEGRPILPETRKMADTVDGLILEFEPFLI